MQTSHHAIAAHRLVVLAEVNTVSQNWNNLLFKLSLAEALEEVATRVAEEAWLRMRTPSISVLIIFIVLTFVLIIRSSKIIPSFFTIKEGSTFLTKPLFPQGREDVTALRCSEPLRYKVGGPSKVFAMVCGMKQPGAERLFILISKFVYSIQRKKLRILSRDDSTL